MTIRITGIWRPGSATYYGLQTTGIGVGIFKAFIFGRGEHNNFFRHKNPTKIRITAQGPTVR
jgi:hypothetical protein